MVFEGDGALWDVDEELDFQWGAGDVGDDGLEGVGFEGEEVGDCFFALGAVFVVVVLVFGVEEALVEDDAACFFEGEGFDFAYESEEGRFGGDEVVALCVAEFEVGLLGGG